MKIESVFIVFSILFAFGVLGTSLVGASSSSSLPSQSISPIVRFSGEIIPGHILYPLLVLQEKTKIIMADSNAQCLARLEIAEQRLLAVSELLDLENSHLALETVVKGHTYLADSVNQFQSEDLDASLKQNLRESLKKYRRSLQDLKPQFQENEQLIIDRLIAENEALQIHLGK